MRCILCVLGVNEQKRQLAVLEHRGLLTPDPLQRPCEVLLLPQFIDVDIWAQRGGVTQLNYESEVGI